MDDENRHKIWLTGLTEIGAAIGCGRRAAARFVREEGLPAFRVAGGRRYTVLREDLDAWSKEIANRYKGGGGRDNGGQP